jgi:hypothetical protein
MFRSKKKQQDDTPAPAAQQQAPAPTSGYARSELTTFDGKGNPTVIVYSTDSVGRTVKSPRGRRRGGH